MNELQVHLSSKGSICCKQATNSAILSICLSAAQDGLEPDIIIKRNMYRVMQ